MLVRGGDVRPSWPRIGVHVLHLFYDLPDNRDSVNESANKKYMLFILNDTKHM